MQCTKHSQHSTPMKVPRRNAPACALSLSIGTLPRILVYLCATWYICTEQQSFWFVSRESESIVRESDLPEFISVPAAILRQREMYLMNDNEIVISSIKCVTLSLFTLIARAADEFLGRIPPRRTRETAQIVRLEIHKPSFITNAQTHRFIKVVLLPLRVLISFYNFWL